MDIQEKFLTEKIKLLTEWLRGFFYLFILDITGIATLLVRQKILTNDFEYYLLIAAAIGIIIIFTIMIIINKRLNKNINLLKQ